MRASGIDQRLLPPIAAAAGRLHRGAAGWWRALWFAGGRRRLTGVVPLTAAAVLIAGAVAAGTSSQPAAFAASCLPRTAPATLVLGPAPGQPVPRYLRAASCRLTAVASRYPGVATYAIADLRSYQPPGRLPGLLAHARIVAAWARYRDRAVATPATEYRVADLAELGSELRLAGRQARERAVSLAVELRANRGRLPARTRRNLLALLRAARADGRGLAPRCRCVFAVVIRATPGVLGSLARDPRVRVVDPAPPYVSYPTIVTVPLLPEARGRQQPLDGGVGGVTGQ
jgi:hypothetical protein